MANDEHRKALNEGVVHWNAWRRADRRARPDLSGLDLRKRSLRDLDLRNVNLSGSDLRDVTFRRSDLSGANLCDSKLNRAFFSGTKVRHTRFARARLYETVFANVDLSTALGLDEAIHRGPSVVDQRTLARSRDLSLAFLQGCGLPDSLIREARQGAHRLPYRSCFISYSSQDHEFASRLHADLQAAGVRCWFAPKDMPIGAEIRDSLDIAIREMSRVILVLSENTLESGWVKKEFETAFEEEARRKEPILLPIRLDTAALSSSRAWVADVRRTRNIGDFSAWRDHVQYKQAVARLLNALSIG